MARDKVWIKPEHTAVPVALSFQNWLNASNNIFVVGQETMKSLIALAPANTFLRHPHELEQWLRFKLYLQVLDYPGKCRSHTPVLKKYLHSCLFCLTVNLKERKLCNIDQ
jgi:hypothetical protein